jgi:uncharacterized membrane protein
MSTSPVLLLHISAGIAGLLSGAVAISLRKGSRRHSVAGNMFVLSMLCLAGAGVYLAALKGQPGNILGGTFTLYLVATAWLAARRRAGKPDLFDWSALLVAFTLAAIEFTFGFEAAYSPTGLKYDFPPYPYFFIGSVAALAAVGDVRMLVRGGISGAPRIARHLWRMCFALFIASSSLFLARQRLFPVFMQKTGMLYLLSFLPLILMIFWLIRIRFANVFQRLAARSNEHAYRADPVSSKIQFETHHA